MGGCNEGFHVLDDFGCEAFLAPGVPRADPCKQGRNEGMALVRENPSMRPLPKKLGGAELLLWAALDERVTATDYCTRIVAGGVVGPAAALAICVYPQQAGFYLFHCNEAWEVKADTWHDTLELAQRQAEAEYAGVSALWRTRG